MVNPPTFVLLTSDLDLAARLQTVVRTRLRARVVWCGSVREVEEHLESEAPVGLLVEVPRRSSRMLRTLRELAGRIPTLALTRPHDESLACRCLASGALQAIPRHPSTEDPLLGSLQTLLDRNRPSFSYAASPRPGPAPRPREISA